MPIPAPPDVAAKNYFVVDFASGKVLAEKNPDAQVEPASITKIMTAYVVYKEIDADRLALDDIVDISEKAWRMGGSRMYLEVNTRVPVHDLLKGLIIQSGNDASVALAEHVAGTEKAFVQLMNQYAKELGMTNTHFVNSTGWPDKKHLTTRVISPPWQLRLSPSFLSIMSATLKKNLLTTVLSSTTETNYCGAIQVSMA